MRLWGPRSQPVLLENDSRRTTGKKLEIDRLVRGSGCWIISDAFQGWTPGKSPDSDLEEPTLYHEHI